MYRYERLAKRIGVDLNNVQAKRDFIERIPMALQTSLATAKFTYASDIREIIAHITAVDDIYSANQLMKGGRRGPAGGTFTTSAGTAAVPPGSQVNFNLAGSKFNGTGGSMSTRERSWSERVAADTRGEALTTKRGRDNHSEESGPGNRGRSPGPGGRPAFARSRTEPLTGSNMAGSNAPPRERDAAVSGYQGPRGGLGRTDPTSRGMERPIDGDCFFWKKYGDCRFGEGCDKRLTHIPANKGSLARGGPTGGGNGMTSKPKVN